MIRVQCLKCRWVGYMGPIGGHLQNVTVTDPPWHLTRCPRCHGLYGEYA